MSIQRIITAKDYSLAEGAGGSVKARILKMRDNIFKQRGISINITDIDQPGGEPVRARIWQGQWIADCPVCNGAQFVDPQEPIYFCFVCGNRSNAGRPRPVLFPPEKQRVQIENLLLDRPVNDEAGLTDLERVGMARPIAYAKKVAPDGQVHTLFLARNWNPDETVQDLIEQNNGAANIKTNGAEGGHNGLQ